MRGPGDQAGRGDAGGTNSGSASQMIRALRVIVASWRLLLGIPLLTATIAVGVRLLHGGEYVAEASFIPQAPALPASGFSGLAAQLGVTMPKLGGESQDFYARLLRSRILLSELAQERFSFPVTVGQTDTIHGTIIQLYHVKGKTPNEALERVVKRLQKDISVSPDVKSEIITVRATAPWPALAEQMNRRILTLVSDFNLNRRQTRAAAERRFVEARVTEARSELQAAEAELAQFLSTNRRYQDSPQLLEDHARLERRVDLRQQVYTTLEQAFEQARIDEVRDTPVITPIDVPEGSATSARNLPLYALIGLFVGVLLATAITVVSEMLARMRIEDPSRFAELVALTSPRARRIGPKEVVRAGSR